MAKMNALQIVWQVNMILETSFVNFVTQTALPVVDRQPTVSPAASQEGNKPI